MTEVASWWVNTVTVEAYRGNTSAKASFDDPQVIPCWVEDGNTLVRDDRGQEVVSSARVFAALDWDDAFAVGSKVTLPGGRSSKVLSLSRFDSGSLDLEIDHIEVALR